MKPSIAELPHKVFVFFLIIVGTLTALTIWARNYSYYLTPLQERPLYARYDSLKPEGIESHGYGVIGTAMIFIGVIVYSTRKRVKKLAHFGKIRDYLDFHIFMCLVGPILIMYHTTFKFGGIAGAGFWCMTAVVLSGFIGRYFYRFIPKNIEGHELTVKELEDKRQQLLQSLNTQYSLGSDLLQQIDEAGVLQIDNSRAGFFKLFWYLLKADFSRWNYRNEVHKILQRHSVRADLVKKYLRRGSTPNCLTATDPRSGENSPRFSLLACYPPSLLSDSSYNSYHTCGRGSDFRIHLDFLIRNLYYQT